MMDVKRITRKDATKRMRELHSAKVFNVRQNASQDNYICTLIFSRHNKEQTNHHSYYVVQLLSQIRACLLP
jgi:hypothetical protein